jgi:hypothetical protein
MGREGKGREGKGRAELEGIEKKEEIRKEGRGE